MKTYDELLAERDGLKYHLARVLDAYGGNSGFEPSLSVFLRAIDEAKKALSESPQQCLAEIRAEAVETSLDAIGAPITKLLGKSNDFVAGFNYCDALLQRHAAKVRQGGSQ